MLCTDTKMIKRIRIFKTGRLKRDKVWLFHENKNLIKKHNKTRK